MEFKEALSIINFETTGTKEQELEAYTIMFKEMFGVDVRNQDGTYKNLYDIFEEANKNINK